MICLEKNVEILVIDKISELLRLIILILKFVSRNIGYKVVDMLLQPWHSIERMLKKTIL